MKEILLVFIGGGVGSTLRYLFGRLVAACLPTPSLFPWATFGVNLLGCLLIGLLSALAMRQVVSADVRLLLVVGLCGGFTTFSTFSNESLALLRAGNLTLFLLYAAASVLLGILAVGLGYRLSSLI